MMLLPRLRDELRVDAEVHLWGGSFGPFRSEPGLDVGI
jgi:hypothetical protein